MHEMITLLWNIVRVRLALVVKREPLVAASRSGLPVWWTVLRDKECSKALCLYRDPRGRWSLRLDHDEPGNEEEEESFGVVHPGRALEAYRRVGLENKTREERR